MQSWFKAVYRNSICFFWPISVIVQYVCKCRWNNLNPFSILTFHKKKKRRLEFVAVCPIRKVAHAYTFHLASMCLPRKCFFSQITLQFSHHYMHNHISSKNVCISQVSFISMYCNTLNTFHTFLLCKVVKIVIQHFPCFF